MKYLITIIILFIFSGNIYAQDTEIDANKLKVSGIPFFAKKIQIITVFGKPIKIYEPNYECGLLSAYMQGTKIYTLDYAWIKFTGNNRFKYVPEIIDLQQHPITLTYNNHPFGYDSTLTDLVHIFGDEIMEQFKKFQQINLFFKSTDDGIALIIENNRLVKIIYLQSC